MWLFVDDVLAGCTGVTDGMAAFPDSLPLIPDRVPDFPRSGFKPVCHSPVVLETYPAVPR